MTLVAGRRRAVAVWLLAAVAYLGVTVAILGPSLVTRCDTTIAGGPGDNTSGPIWQSWNYDELGTGPFAGHTPLVHPPHGAPLFEPHEVTSLALVVPMWAMTHVVGPVCSFNVAVIGGFVLNGLLTFGLVRWLTGRPFVAFFAGYAFAFTPFHVYKAYGQLGYVSTWAFPLMAWALLAFWRRPTVRRALLVAGSVLLAFYTDGYYLLIAPVTVGAFVLGAVVHDRLSAGRWPWKKLRPLLAAAGAIAIVSVPIVYTLVTERGAIESVVGRSRRDLYVYSARPWEWVLPARTHPVFAEHLGAWQDRHLHDSNYSEQTLFPGLTVIGLAGASLVWLARRRRASVADDDPHLAVSPSLVVATMAVVVVVSALFSLPPTVRGVPMPSDLVYRVAHFWRVYSRFFVPLDLALVVLAGVALARVATASLRREAVVVLLVLPLLAFELLAASRPQTWSFRDRTPAVYRWLADQPRDAVVAEYPLVLYPAYVHLLYLTFQTVHEHPLLNGARLGTAASRTEASLFGLADPQTIPTLRRLGVDVVIVHPQEYAGAFGSPPDLAAPPPGLVPVFTSADAVAYRLDRGPPAPAMVRLGGGFFPAEAVGWGSRHWMTTEADLEVVSFGRDRGGFDVSFDVTSSATPRRVTVTQGDVVLWEGSVATDATPVAFHVPRAGPLRISASPGARRVSDVVPGSPDLRSLSVALSRLDVVPATTGA